ncbi:MFS transporter [Steroidobacter cummioxidans]|uniref:MFS transporter n=1 Tax=Steroidobacter cummioxidans TaxID=1803913 RepID=UPI000E31F93A|nr:MFS transporter [Steroidobacter cummioxidans]
MVTTVASALNRSIESVKQSMANAQMSATQRLVVGLCFFLNMIDGMDVLVLSFAAPVLAQELAIDATNLGQLFSTGLLGMAFGGLVLGPTADRFGRKAIMLVALCLMSCGMIRSAFSQSFRELLILRFFTGVGVGAMLVSMAALASEYANDRSRNFAVAFVQAGYPLGAMLTGFFAAWAIPTLGWRSLFVAGGVISAITLPLIAWLMPESLAFLSQKQPPHALQRINRILARMGRAAVSVLPERLGTPTGRTTLSLLFSNGMMRSTLLLWGGAFFGFSALYFLSSWIPRIAVDAGLPISEAIYAGTMFNIGGLVGTIIIGWMGTRYDIRKMMALFFCIGAVVLTVFGLARVPLLLTLTLALLMGVFVQGAFNGTYPAAARLYSTEVRATGVGWAMGIGRAGAILGPLLAGYLIEKGVDRGILFSLFALPLLFSAAAARRLRGGELK